MTLILPYQAAKANILGGTAGGGLPVDYLTDTLKAAHLTSAYTPDMAVHDFWNDVSGQELAAGDGYTALGLALGSKAVAIVGGNAEFDAADLAWTFTALKSFEYTVIFKDTGTASTSPLLWLIDHEAVQNVTGDYTLRLNASGLFRIS